MRIAYVLLSSTFGMHQYTADLANRMLAAGHEVHLITTKHAPRDRYAPDVQVHEVTDVRGTGFSREGLRLHHQRRVLNTIRDLPAAPARRAAGSRVCPDVVHFTGPHLWNPLLIGGIARQGIPVVQTLHDLDPHAGTPYGVFVRLWNRLIIQSDTQILVHGQVYRDRLVASGVNPERVSCTPLLHLFLSHDAARQAAEQPLSITYEPWALFFGRIEPYKGIDCLLTALGMLDGRPSAGPLLVLAGPGNLESVWPGPLPGHLQLNNHLIQDGEALDLFLRCRFLVLPYTSATQSSLVAAAYYFRKPVIATRMGALPEYVQDGHTGRIVEPGDPAALARGLEELLADSARCAEMGSQGRRWYDEQRGRETQALLDLYAGLADRTRPRSMPRSLPAFHS